MIERSKAETPRALGYRMPAEWERHRATWLAWPHNAEDWPGKFDRIPNVFLTLVAALAEVERVRLIVGSPGDRETVRRLLADRRANVGAVDFFEAPTDRSWTRDFLPLFVKGVGGQVRAVKWRFDGWARYDNHERDEAAGRSVAEWLGLASWNATADRNGEPAPIVLEGGAIDVDGEGTLLASKDCLVSGARGRNAWLGDARTETALADYLGADRVIWVGEGVVGDDTSGHVDDFVRFGAPGTVLLAEERNPSDPNHRALEETRERLEAARDARGRKLEIVRVPMPAPVLWEGERLPASYANYYVANDLVLVPTFDDPNDQVALGILGEAFPSRKITGVYAGDLVLGLGTIHCSTHEEPAPVP